MRASLIYLACIFSFHQLEIEIHFFLIFLGVTTLEKLKVQKLNHVQTMGLKYINDFDKRVPREEVKKLFSIVKKYAKKIDNNIILKCCGSYRRKCKDCGDIDILLSHPKFTTEQRINQEEPMKIISKLITILTKKGFLVDHLFQGTLQYSGICKLQDTIENLSSKNNNRNENNNSNNKPIARKIDIKLFPIESFYTGLLAYTGSGEFIRQVSTIAINKGFKLNEYQLVPVGLTGVEGESIEIKNEKDIFDMLGITYREPEMRSFGGTHLNKNRSI
jgi:DNA polymerase beta